MSSQESYLVQGAKSALSGQVTSVPTPLEKWERLRICQYARMMLRNLRRPALACWRRTSGGLWRGNTDPRIEDAADHCRGYLEVLLSQGVGPLNARQTQILEESLLNCARFGDLH